LIEESMDRPPPRDPAQESRDVLVVGSGADLRHFLNATRAPASALRFERRLRQHVLDVARHRGGTQLVNGNAPVPRPLRALDGARRFNRVWRYPGLDDRAAIRAGTMSRAIRPPKGGAGWLAGMRNTIRLPTAVSPLR
jgi:hypothetical protein